MVAEVGRRAGSALLVRPPTLPGLAAAVAIAAVATVLGHLLPVVGGPVFGIVLGVVTAVVARRAAHDRARVLRPGAAVAARAVLQVSIVLLGTGLPLTRVAHTGASSLPVMVGTLAVALGGAVVVGRLLRVRGATRTLIGVGTGICGAAAIAAVTAVIGAADAEVSFAIVTIFTFNVTAVLLFPAIGHALGLSQHAFGLWSGTAINDTSSVVAATTTYGTAAASYGVVVKLTRSLMIIPVCVALGAIVGQRAAAGDAADSGFGRLRRLPWRRMFPLFLIGFLAASAVDSAGGIPGGWHGPLTRTSSFLITVALSGIGLTTEPHRLRAAGARPLILGAVLWVAVAVTSLLLQLATGSL